MTLTRSSGHLRAPLVSFHPRLEHLEDRATPATFNVTTKLDVVDPADGKRSLREAISASNTTLGPDVIILPAGLCRMVISGTGDDANLSGDFDIADDLTVQGSGAGLTIIDGQQLDRAFDVLGTAPSSIKVVLDKLTIRNGNVTGDGGAIRVGNADLVVRDCFVAGNRASDGGGGISNGTVPGTGNVKVVRTTVVRNVALGGGGGLFVDGGGSVLTVRDSAVRRNIAGVFGGGLFANVATLTSSTVSGNTSGSSGGINAGNVTLSNCTVSDNSARSNGGGMLASTATLTNCTVSGNTAGSNGGGINASTATLTNCTVSGNSAISATSQGGGIFGFEAILLNCTVVENSAHTGGGVFENAGNTFSVRNTIIALNLTDFTGTGPDVSGAFSSLGHNLIGDGTGGTGIGINFDIVGTSVNPIDPKLGPLANNGGKTNTHALLAGSPALDHGDNVSIPTTDQRGFPRKKDSNGDGVAVVDIGAFER